MANLITDNVTYTKQDALQLFFKDVFVEGELAQDFTVYPDIKNTETLSLASALSGITKAYAQGTAFTPSTGATIDPKVVTVVGLKAEVQQNGKTFANSVRQMLLKKGVDENDITDTVLAQIIYSIFEKAVKRDALDYAWMSDTAIELTSSSIKTGVADETMNAMNGAWKKIIADFASATIAATQRVTMDNGAVAQVEKITLSGSTGSATITVMGKTYAVAWSSNLTATAALFVTNHAAALALRGVTVTSATAVLTFTSAIAGVPIGTVAITAAASTGTLTGARAAVTANTAPAALAADEALTALENMVKAMPEEMVERQDMLVIHCTRSFANNYRESLQATGAGEQAYTATVDGVKVLAFNGIPMKEHAIWDTAIASKLGGAYPHRALMTIKENLALGTDGAEDAVNIEVFYDKVSQNNFFRTEYKMSADYLWNKLIVAAY